MANNNNAANQEPSDDLRVLDTDFYTSLGKVFREALELEKFDDSELTPDEPYKSKYEARKKYVHVLDTLTKAASKVENDANDCNRDRISICRATTLLHLGINAYETEEVSDGERHLRDCLQLVEARRLDPKFVTLFMCASNHTGIVWNLRKNHEKSLAFFLNAKQAYADYKGAYTGNGNCKAPDELMRCFAADFEKATDNADEASANDDDEKKRLQDFEGIQTHTLYFLAQCYERMGQKEQAALCCHETLLRQVKRENSDLDACDWSRNAAILSQYYVGIGAVKVARHCLAAAAVMFGGQEFKTEAEEKEEERNRTAAEIKRCWAALALCLLRYSREADIVARGGDRDPDVNDRMLETLKANVDEDVSKSSLSFVEEGSRLDHEKVADQESKVDVLIITSFDDARTLFLFGTNCLEDAKSFYTKDSHCSDYVAILQSTSQLYKVLADFETDVGRKCKMHKRRIDLLSDILRELNPTYYLMVMRQLQYELGEVHSIMMDLKYTAVDEAAKSGVAPKRQVVEKINALTKGAVDSFQDFLTSFHVKNESGESRCPETFEDMNVRPVLGAYFHVARLYSKFVETDPRRRVVKLEVAAGFYKKLVDYVDTHPEAMEAIEEEYKVSKELVPMMEVKIRSIKSSAMSKDS